VLEVYMLVAEDPAKPDARRAGIVGRAEVPVGRAAQAIQPPTGAGTHAGVPFGHVLPGRLAGALGGAELGGHRERIVRTPLAVEGEAVGAGAFVGSRRLVVDAVLG